jgi:hypothetical protein
VVVVVGNTEALGNMDAAKGARLYTTPETFPLWKGAAELPVGDFKYRFAILAAPHCGGLEREREEFPDHVHRRIKVLPPCLDCSVFLSTDLDGTLIGDQAATDHFFMGWGSQFAGRVRTTNDQTKTCIPKTLDSTHRALCTLDPSMWTLTDLDTRQ